MTERQGMGNSTTEKHNTLKAEECWHSQPHFASSPTLT